MCVNSLSFPKINIMHVIWSFLDNKKARHPVGLFCIWCVRYNSCRTCILHCCLFLFLSGASCSLWPHDRKLMKNGIDAKHLNECALKRTSLATFYPKSCPQKLGIVSAVDGLINHNNASFLIKNWSILLARSIKSAHKKANLFLSRFFAVFEVG